MDSVEQNDGPEALGWLRQDPPPLCFVWNKCGEKVAWAISFVEGLYALGSPRVVIPRWSIKEVAARPWRPGGLEACAFGVYLPKTGPEREALIWFCAAQMDGLRMSVARAGQFVGAEFVVLARI